MPQTPDTHPPLPAKGTIHAAQDRGRDQADAVSDDILEQVAICHAYFRTVARMALRSANADLAFDQFLEMHNLSARNELRLLREELS